MPNKDSIIQFKFGLQTNFNTLSKDPNTIYFIFIFKLILF